MGSTVTECYCPKPRHSGAIEVSHIAWFADGHVDEEVKRALIAEYSYSVRCFPAEVARNQSRWGRYIKELQRKKRGWQSGDRIFRPEEHERMRAGLAAGLNIRQILDEMSGKRGERRDGTRCTQKEAIEFGEGVLLPAV